MRFSSIIAALAAAVPFTQAAFSQGFNVAANNPANGACLTTAQWEQAMKKLKTLPQKFANIRVYAASDCNTLELAVPAALKTGTKILVGVWTEDEEHYQAEMAALKSAITAHGSSWILAISVGSEDLYRGDTTASVLAGQVNQIRTMVRGMKVEAPVGHVDTWTAWVDSANDAVIEAVDFLGMDGYPYFQNVTIAEASSTFWQSVTATKNAAQGKPVWVTETGWPVSGPTSGSAVPSVANAITYWKEVYCKAAKTINIFWYVYQDYSASPSFGVFNSAGKSIYDLGACT